MKFEKFQFSEEINKGLEAAGLVKTTDIQFKAIPSIRKGEDVLAIAQTGTGKTAAFAIPVLNELHLKKNPKRPDGIKCIVMVPTRELAIQITEVFQTIGKFTRLNIFSVFGGVEQDAQIAELEKGIDILVTTPGRMFDLVSQGHIHLNRIEVLILDEADHMLNLGFIKDIRDLISFLPKRRQTLFFSATIDQKIKDLAYSLVENPIRIQLSPKDPVSKNVNHKVAFVEMDDKRFFLERIVTENPKSKILVFVRTQVRAERVCKAMERVSIKAETIHGGKEQKSRLDVITRFRSGDITLLIATDVSARGIDIPNVEYVVNYDLPDHEENYVHRVGRTGRGRNKGDAIAFCSTEEKEMLGKIETYLGKKILTLDITKKELKETIEESLENKDWQSLITEQEEWTKKNRKKNKRNIK